MKRKERNGASGFWNQGPGFQATPRFPLESTRSPHARTTTGLQSSLRHHLVRKSRLLIVLLVSCLSAVSTAAQPEDSRVRWERIDKKTVNHDLETDSISVDKEDRFRALKLRVIDAGVLIEEWILEYQDETIQHVPFKGFLRTGAETPPIPLLKPLEKVRFKYYSISDEGKKASIELLGRR